MAGDLTGHVGGAGRMAPVRATGCWKGAFQMNRIWLSAVLATSLFSVPVYSADALLFHFMQIEQVIGGVYGDTTAQAIQLRMRTTFQEFVSQGRLRVWDAGGLNPVMVINFGSDVDFGACGRRVLITSPNFNSLTTPSSSPSLVGTYVFGDFAQMFVLPSGNLYFLAEPVPGNFEIRRFRITKDDIPYGLFLKGFGEDEEGEIYACGSLALAPFGDTGVVERIVVVPDAAISLSP